MPVAGAQYCQTKPAAWRRKLLLSTHREIVKSSPNARACSDIRGLVGGGVGVLSEAEQLSFAKGPEGLFSPHPARAVMFDRVWKVTHLSLFPVSLSLEPSPRDGKCYICRYHFSHLSKSVVSEPRKDDPKRSRDGEMINVSGTKSWQHLILFRCRTLTE